MKTLDSSNFGSKLYERFPPAYIEEDARQKYALKRYLQSANDGGFKEIIEDTNGLIGLVDYSQTRADILPLLLEHYGLEVFHGIPDDYLRYLVPQIGKIWETKGTVESIEYFTSLLSGIRTITEVTYDDNDDPFMNVILEMDYNVGDYIPDAGRFKRLLENVIPFYVDYELIYRYLFSDLATLKEQESEFDKITDTKYENGSFFYKGVKDPNITESLFGKFTFGSIPFNTLQEDLADVFKDSIKQIIAETQRLTPIEESLFNLVLAPYLDSAKVGSSEIAHDLISTEVVSDLITLSRSGFTNSFFNGADNVFSASIFGDTETDKATEHHRMTITENIAESGVTRSVENTSTSTKIVVTENAKSNVRDNTSSTVGYATVRNSLFAVADFGRSVFNDLSYDYVEVDY